MGHIGYKIGHLLLYYRKYPVKWIDISNTKTIFDTQFYNIESINLRGFGNLGGFKLG